MLNYLKFLYLNFQKPKRTHKIQVSKSLSLDVYEFGNLDGAPVFFLHGGPGGSWDNSNLKWFSLKKHRIILYNQRFSEIETINNNYTSKDNTTWDHVNDLEAIRKELNLTTFSIVAGSWGSCLALTYAITYPTNINNLFLWGILLGNKKDTEYIPQEFLSPQEKHYCDNLFFFPKDNWILENCTQIKEIPLFITHGEKDIICSPNNAVLLSQKSENFNLYLDKEGVHSSSSKGIYNYLKQSIKNNL